MLFGDGVESYPAKLRIAQFLYAFGVCLQPYVGASLCCRIRPVECEHRHLNPPWVAVVTESTHERANTPVLAVAQRYKRLVPEREDK